MVKYIKIDWQDCQYYVEHERAAECYCCYPYDEIPESTETFSSLMVPEDLYYEVEENKLYPANIVIPEFGTATVTKDTILIGDVTWSRDLDQLKRGSEVILYSPEKGYWTTKCVAYSFNMPPLFEDSSTLIECEIVGIKND